MNCEKCNTEMDEAKVIGINKIITVFWECPKCGFQVDNDDDQ